MSSASYWIGAMVCAIAVRKRPMTIFTKMIFEQILDYCRFSSFEARFFALYNFLFLPCFAHVILIQNPA